MKDWDSLQSHNLYLKEGVTLWDSCKDPLAYHIPQDHNTLPSTWSSPRIQEYLFVTRDEFIDSPEYNPPRSLVPALSVCPHLCHHRHNHFSPELIYLFLIDVMAYYCDRRKAPPPITQTSTPYLHERISGLFEAEMEGCHRSQADQLFFWSALDIMGWSRE